MKIKIKFSTGFPIVGLGSSDLDSNTNATTAIKSLFTQTSLFRQPQEWLLQELVRYTSIDFYFGLVGFGWFGCFGCFGSVWLFWFGRFGRFCFVLSILIYPFLILVPIS